jgi:uncharacterized protein (DUF305 family)
MSEKYLYGIIGLLAGIVLAVAVGSVTMHRHHTKMMGMMERNGMGNMMKADSSMHHSGNSMLTAMQGMTSEIANKTGEEFDKAFLGEMIVHHQGAIDMARAALQYAQHQEIKDLANAIIGAQENEINQMRAWQKTWYNQ